MTEVLSPEFLKTTVASFKDGRKAFSNCFLMPDELQRLTAKKKLFVLSNSEWLFLLCSRGDYFSAYYYAFDFSTGESAKDLFGAESFSKEILLDVTFRGASGDRETVKKLVSCGVFKEYKTYKRMTLSLKDIEKERLEAKLAPGYRLEKSACFTDVLSLWKEALDEKSTPLPDSDAFARFEENGLFYALKDKEDKLGCVLILNRKGKTALAEHLVCSPTHRRKGLAKSLFQKVLAQAKESGVTTVKLWVDEKNAPAVSLYEKLGFLDDGTKSEQYKK